MAKSFKVGGSKSPSREHTSPSPSSNDGGDEAVRVAVRVRPLNYKEERAKGEICVSMNPRRHEVIVSGEPNAFPVDDPLWSIDGQNALDGSAPKSQADVYTQLGEPLLQNALDGYNSTILAYGQTGSGKTFTMMGNFENDAVENGTEGIIPRLCDRLFEEVTGNNDRISGNAGKETFSWSVKAVYVEIYCEHVTDLLSKNAEPTIRQIGEGFQLQGVKRVDVHSKKNVMDVVRVGNDARKTAATKMNDRSSRSHAVFILELVETLTMSLPDGTKADAPSKKLSIKLVDLAGSERTGESGVTGQNMKEANAINLSLFTLGLIIETLTDPKRRGMRPPYRDSQLTKILKDSFGGNSKTTMIATVGPTLTYKSQTVQTLLYATRARKITNKPTIEEDPQAAELRRKQAELDDVKRQLDEALKNGGGAGSEELKRELKEQQERFHEEQEEAQRKAAEMARREQELTAQLEAKAEQDRVYEEKMAQLEKDAEEAGEEQKRREKELKRLQEEADEQTRQQAAALEASKSRIAEIQRQQAEAEAAAAKREKELRKKQEKAAAEAAKREEEFKKREEAQIAEAAKREKELAARQEKAEEESRKREKELKERSKQQAAHEEALNAKLQNINDSLATKEKELAAKDAQRKKQEKDLSEKNQKLHQEEEHRQRGNENASSFVNELMLRIDVLEAEVKEHKKRYKLLRKSKVVICPRCTLEQSADNSKCTACGHSC